MCRSTFIGSVMDDDIVMDITMETNDQISGNSGHDCEQDIELLRSSDGTTDNSGTSLDSNVTQQSMDMSQSENTNGESADNSDDKACTELEADEATTEQKNVASNPGGLPDENVQIAGCEECSMIRSQNNIVPSTDTSNGASKQPAPSDNNDVTSGGLLESDGDDLLMELDKEEPAPANSDPSKHSDFISLPIYRELKVQNTELIKEQERMKLEIERLNKAVEESNMRKTSEKDIYAEEIKKLKLTISSQQLELDQTKHKLQVHDASAKKAVAALQNELHLQAEKIKSVEEEATKEKEKMTIKYAQSEQKNIKLQQSQNHLELQIKDMLKEREVMIGRFKAIKAEKQKLQELYDSKVTEVCLLRKELEKEKEAKMTLEVKLKWHQNKLQAEFDNNKEMKMKIEDLQRKLKEAKEETEVMRHDYHEMIKTYQESDEIRSNSLEKQVKVKNEELQQHLQEKTDHEEVHSAVVKELDALKKKHRDAIEELRTLKDKVTCLEAERITQEHTLDKFKETLQNQKYENKQLSDKLVQLDDVNKHLTSAESRIKQLEAELVQLQETNKELIIDMEGCSKRESEHLIFSQKMSDKNAQLQSENNSLSHKLSAVMEEQQRLASLCNVLEEKVVRLEEELEAEKTLRKEDVQNLTSSLESKSRAVEELSRMIEEERDENRTLKRKHNAYTKDLLRQLHQTRKRLEQYEQNHAPSERDSLSVGSRTSSTGSLDILGNSGNSASNQSSNPATNTAHSCHNAITHQEEEPPVVEVVEVDKQMLLDKIVRLQKAHARKNEKIEFMEDHINQLVADIQKKTRIIQHYLLSEETGSLSPEFMDRHKAQLAKKGGIMASLYNSQSQDGTMSLELSLEINHKLQAVLEDTILKNMTYKDNLMTLGEEISRLSQENRRLQLQAMKQPTS